MIFFFFFFFFSLFLFFFKSKGIIWNLYSCKLKIKAMLPYMLLQECSWLDIISEENIPGWLYFLITEMLFGPGWGNKKTRTVIPLSQIIWLTHQLQELQVKILKLVSEVQIRPFVTFINLWHFNVVLRSTWGYLEIGYTNISK